MVFHSVPQADHTLACICFPVCIPPSGPEVNIWKNHFIFVAPVFYSMSNQPSPSLSVSLQPDLLQTILLWDSPQAGWQGLGPRRGRGEWTSLKPAFLWVFAFVLHFLHLHFRHLVDTLIQSNSRVSSNSCFTNIASRPNVLSSLLRANRPVPRISSWNEKKPINE